MKLAVLSNNEKLFESISSRVMTDGFTCTRFSDEIRLARAALRSEFAAILLDASRGLDALRPALRRHKRPGEHQLPVIVIALRADSNDIEIAFELGADDVVTEPLDHRELLARVRCAARRSAPLAAALDRGRIELGTYRFENTECSAYLGGKPVALANREFALAWLLFSRPGEFVSRREIAAAVWTSSEDVVGRSLEQHVYKLRKKLRLNGDHGITLRTRYALGYRIELHDTTRPALEIAAPPRDDARPLNPLRDATARGQASLSYLKDELRLAPRPLAMHATPREDSLLRRRRDDLPLSVEDLAHREAMLRLRRAAPQQLNPLGTNS